ncbi:MAG: acetyl-CoA C-acyltransferase, partial [bacterium]
MPTFGSPGRRVAIVAGLRTPFARSGTTLKSVSAIDLGKHCVAELIQRSDIDPALVDAIIYGTVVQSVLAPNIAREVSLLPILPKGVQAFTVGRACA